MANRYNIFFKISVIFQLVTLISTGYLHGQYVGNLIDKQINFSVFITKSPGVIFYAVDTQNNKLLISIEKKNNAKILITKFNSFITSIKKEKLHGCKVNENIYINFLLQLRQEKIILKCRNYTESLQLQQKDTDQIIGYPIPIYFNDYSNTTFIWMGNIGNYIGNKNVQYEPFINQLSGCLDYLFYDKYVKMNEIENVNEIEKDFKNTCDIQYNETKCDQVICRNFVTVYKVYQCTFEVINGRHCKQDLGKFIAQDNPYYIKLDHENKISLRLEWKKKKSNLYNDFCLMEIEFTDENLAQFSINNDGEFRFLIHQSRSGFVYTKFIKKISDRNLNNILLIIYQDSELIVKVSNYNEIHSYFIHPIVKPKLVNVGYFRQMSGFSRFDGDAKFQVHLNQYRSSHANSTKSDNNKTKHKRNLFITLSIGAVLLIIICFVIMIIIKLKRRIKTNVKGKHVKSSKRSSPNHYEYEMNSNSSKEVENQDYETIPNEFEDNPN